MTTRTRTSTKKPETLETSETETVETVIQETETETEENSEKVETELKKEHGANKFEDMKKGILDLADNGASKAKMEGFLCYAHDLSTTEAKAFIAHIVGKGRTGIGNLAEVVKLTRKRFDDSMTAEQKKSLTAELVKLSGAKESAITRMLSQIPFAREWARQENGETETK